MRKILIFLGIIGFLTLAGVSLQSIFQSNSVIKNENKSENIEQTSQLADASGQRYQQFSQELLDESTDRRRVLFFFANWCPTCLPADKDLSEKMNEIPEDVVVLRVNYNDTDTDQVEKDLAKKYGVTYQHTYVQIDAQGNKIHSWNGGQLRELLSNLK